MVFCDACNYYSEKNGKKKCEFAKESFTQELYDMDKYPCEEISYDSYLESSTKEDLQRVS